MSKTKQIIELTSPSLKSRHETLKGLSQPCHYCSGGGWFWGADDWGEPEKHACPLCNGRGKLRPVITIDWEPV